VPWILWVARRDLLPLEFYQPGEKKEGPIPVHPYWKDLLWISLHSLPPLLIQMAWYYMFPSVKWNTYFFWAFLFVSHSRYLTALIRYLHSCIKFYGVLDKENSGRDIPRDNEVYRLSTDIFAYNLTRGAGAVFLGGYNPDIPPSFGLQGACVTPFLLLKMVVWFITMDFFFYVYHRACHEVPALWRIHSKHHGTRHPTPLQAVLASDIQEVIEIALVPLLATLVVQTCFFPMNSYELWITMCSLVFVEAMGHTGARAYWGQPLLQPFLGPLGLGMIVEDHDLHHRNGKSGKCYGKQSLLWDTLFGTVGKRKECVNENVAF
jgi:sterol desaturase/sphingolipid hydroxylase (fatty acid hydroxylase superfamily)